MKTDTRYFRYYPCIMNILIFPSKIWAKKVYTIHGKIHHVLPFSLPKKDDLNFSTFNHGRN